MISAATTILSTTIGLVFGKIYDNLTGIFIDGELVDEWLYNRLVTSINQANSNLRFQSLANVYASYRNLKDGIIYLSSAPGTFPNPKNNAQERFRQSRVEATLALSDRSLSIKDRIVALLLRVVAMIHESGCGDPEGTTSVCISTLEDQHSEPAIQEMFSVFLRGGLKSKFMEAERLENIMLILYINCALFLLGCQEKGNYHHLTNWPEIKLHDRTFCPIKNVDKIWAKISRRYKLVQLVNQNNSFWKIFTSQKYFAVNSRDEIIALTHGDKMTIIYKDENQVESKDFLFPDTTATLESERCSLAVDGNDNVYVVRWRKARDENGNDREDFVLYIFDGNYNIKQTSILDFINASEYKHVDIAVNENRSLIIMTNRENQVYVCDNRGNMKVTFRQNEHWLLMNMSISDNNEIATVSDDGHVVRIHSSDGTLKRTKTFSGGQKAKQVAFCSDTSKLKVLTCVGENDCWFRYCYSEIGECEASVRLFQLKKAEEYWWKNNMHTLPTTAVPVAIGKNIAFI